MLLTGPVVAGENMGVRRKGPYGVSIQGLGGVFQGRRPISFWGVDSWDGTRFQGTRFLGRWDPAAAESPQRAGQGS